MINGKILIKLDKITDVPGVVLHSKNINGTRYYMFDENDIEKIISSHMSLIAKLRHENRELRKNFIPEKKHEPYKRETGNRFGGGYGD